LEVESLLRENTEKYGSIINPKRYKKRKRNESVLIINIPRN
jgi:hypothetical protein